MTNSKELPQDQSHSAFSVSGEEDAETRNPDSSQSDYILLGHKMKAPKLQGGLYIASTPIGNLKDITIRCLEVLASADVIACEDTRVSRKLLSHYGIRSQLVTYHEHNADRQRPFLLEKLEQGQVVVLISDAGTPLLSDPGYKLVEDVVNNGFDIIPVPGASALLAALVPAGLPTDQIHFAGFLPQKSGARQAKLENLASIPGTLIFYESPRRLGAVLPAMAEQLGADRKVVIARELTKKFEEFRRGTLEELSAYYKDAEAPKGEAVILVGPAIAKEPDAEDIDAMIRQGLEEGLHVKQLSADIAQKTGQKKNEIYKRAQQIKDALKSRA
ncbi:MAG: 16S rRNA (cytidine(1402)-2'-O)-methyltransferase [Cohaesibacter sp.]|jgi:16S rRNA (cytidine1402-2'-O)-methyltransferase|nr:16S rRNA (cytidine(1402)-2'-O)-methyltransferase [Cohaesibacter sp.]